jgi:phosphatidylinositol-3-phosphatase
MPRAASPCRGARAPKRYAHVIWIWFENHGIDQVIGSKQAPYFTSVARTCGLATRYSAITHPSLPNYIAATSGGIQGIHGDGPPSKNATRARSIFELARSWKAYEESMPRPCNLRNGGKGYAVRHDPAAYYLRLRPQLCRRDVPLGAPNAGALSTDLRHNHLPKFSFITPNTCNDMHDCSVGTGDSWLRQWLPAILRSRAYRSGKTAIFLTFDESEGGGGNHVATIVIAPSVRRGKRTAAPLSHYSLLRTTETMLGLRPLLGAAAHAGSIRPRLHV